ncbi:MAG TPA: hypothetical protein VF599_02905 [Pyrinomonadaceae bacterium]|jgi:hypothetical protein
MLNFAGKICLLALSAVFYQTNCGEAAKNANFANSTKERIQQSEANKKTVVSNSNEVRMEEEKTKDLPVLQTNISLIDKHLQIEYTVKNTTAKPIYIFNILWETSSGNYRPLPQSAYVSLKTDGVLHLSKQIPALPKTMKVEVREIPFVTKIEAGKEFTETVKLAVPVEEYNPYFPKESDSTEEAKTAETAVFSLQFIRESAELEIEPAPIKDAFSVWHPNLFGTVETLSSKPKDVSVQVKKRTDSFERF